jgi:hypothetical protein
VVDEFFRLRKAQGHLKWLTARSVSVLLKCLGIEWAVDDLATATPCEALVASYRDYLLAERGLVSRTFRVRMRAPLVQTYRAVACASSVVRQATSKQ